MAATRRDTLGGLKRGSRSEAGHGDSGPSRLGRARRRRSWALWLALLLVVPGAALATPAAPSFQIVGGTWVTGSSGRLVGPAWELDSPLSSFTVTVTGPGGFQRRVGGFAQRFTGMPSTRSIHWCNPDSCDLTGIDGAWTAAGDDGTQASFTIDQSVRLTPVAIDRWSFTSETHSVTGSWRAGSDAGSFVVYVQPASSNSATDWIAGKILPGSVRTVTFDGLDLAPATLYSFDIFAFSGDVAGGPPPAVFNIASDRVDFQPGRALVERFRPQDDPALPSQPQILGSLVGTVSAAGTPALTADGKRVANLPAGRYVIDLTDSSGKAGFVLQKARGKAIRLTTAGFVGRRRQAVTLTAGRWQFSSATGSATSFVVRA